MAFENVTLIFPLKGNETNDSLNKSELNVRQTMT